MFVMAPRHAFFYVKHKTAYEMRISDWSSDVCSSDLLPQLRADYIDAGKVRLVFRDFPLDRLPLAASLVARCAPPGRSDRPRVPAGKSRAVRVDLGGRPLITNKKTACTPAAVSPVIRGIRVY